MTIAVMQIILPQMMSKHFPFFPLILSLLLILYSHSSSSSSFFHFLLVLPYLHYLFSSPFYSLHHLFLPSSLMYDMVILNMELSENMKSSFLPALVPLKSCEMEPVLYGHYCDLDKSNMLVMPDKCTRSNSSWSDVIKENCSYLIKICFDGNKPLSNY